jgi:hypothetical protein
MLQLDLDRNGVAAVAMREIARIIRVFGEDGPNLGCQALDHLQRGLVDGLAEGSGSGRALIFSPIENRFFSKT